MAIKHVALVLFVTCVCSYVSGHITLTFPPARKYAFDFMDNIRTRGPCGVPKGLGPVTDLTVGTIVNVHWHTAYPHLGGYRIALLDRNEVETHVFTPNTSEYHGANDPTTLQYNITLPNQECRNCSIQLIRQAGEWNSNCGDYIFYSCADVNILPQNAPNNNKCVHGTANSSGICICEKTYVGEQCTYKEDCVTNDDCNNHGSCFRVSTTYYPHSQCYCKQGWFGRYCQLESPIKEKITNFSSYKMTELSSEYKLYHKILRETNEIEVVMRVKSLTWIGLGWRPSSFRSGCQYFPPLPGIIPGNGTGPTSNPEITAEPEATSEPELTAEPEATSEPELTTEPEAITEPKTTSEPELTSEPTKEPTSEPTKEPTSEPGPSQRTCGGSWKSCGGSKCNYHAEWDYDVVEDEIKFTIAANVSQSQWVAIGFSDNKSMPSSDIYIGWVHDGQVFVSDRWASGNLLPQNDTQQNGEVVSGSYNNEMATVSFTRKRNTGDTSKDIMFTDTYCPYFLFASGGNFAPTTSGDYSFTKHTWYQSSDNRICIKACGNRRKRSDNDKPGSCPASTSNAGTCEEACNSDNSCQGDKKCCSHGCGHSCTNPVNVPETTPENVATSVPETTPENVATSVPETAPENVATSVPETTPEGGSSSEPESTAEGETVAEEPSACGSLPAGTSDTTGVNPHAMDCTDMVIGNARDNLSRIGDYYTRGRSTPQYDSFYGGSESLTAAFGYEENGFTTIIFRKKLTANERSDLSILNEHMHVIWARGQDRGNYSHSPPTGIDRVPTSSLSIPKFYKQDELKYHGHNSHRGVSRINFREGEVVRPVCANTWGTCTDSNCHMVHWSLDDTTKLITFNITADLESNQWVGLGFNDKKQMANADSIIGWVTPDGQISLRDMKNLNSYGVPRIDTGNQDIQDIQGSRVGSRTTISFKRPLTTNDNDDFQFTETNCAYFMFPKGGGYDHATPSFTKHDLTPIMSTNKICFPCTSDSTNHMYVVEFRFIGIVWNRYYTDTTSEEYRNLKREVEEALTEKLKNSPGFQSVFIIRFKSGSVTAEIGIEMTGVETDTKTEVNRVLSDIVQNEKVLSSYVLDHDHSLKLGDARPVEKNTMAPPPHEHEEIHIAVWFIVAITGATLLLIVIMGLCNHFRKNKNTKRLPTQPNTHMIFPGNGEQRLIQSPNGQQTLAKPQLYEDWLEANEPKPSVAQNMRYDNQGYTEGEYKIEATFL